MINDRETAVRLPQTTISQPVVDPSQASPDMPWIPARRLSSDELKNEDHVGTCPATARLKEDSL